MKKLLYLLSLVIVLFSGVVTAEQWEGTIQLWDFPHGADVDIWWEELIKEFEQANPGVTIEFTKLTWGGGNQKIDVAVASGMLPDIVLQGTKMKYIEQGVLEDLTPYFTAEEIEDFYPAALAGYSYKGGIYGWPWYLFPYHLYLNTDLFRERGVALPENGQWSYQEFVRKMQELTFDRDGDGEVDVYGFVYNVQPDFYDSWPIILSDGAKVFNQEMTEFTLDSAAGISGLQKLIDLEHKYRIALPNSAGMNQGVQWAAYTTEQSVAATATGVWGIGAINSQNKKLAEMIEEGEDTAGRKHFNLAVANYPIGNSGEPRSFVLNGGFAVFKQQDQAKLAMIIKFLRYATSTQAQETVAPKFHGFVPSRSSVSADQIYAHEQNMLLVIEMMETAMAWPPLIPDWDKIGEKIQRQIQLACLGEITAEEALKIADREVTRILKRMKR